MSEEVVSPDHQYRVSFGSYEIRMSHWIDQPFLIRTDDNVCLFSLDADDWSAGAVRWLDNATVEMFVRKYPGQLACTVTLDVSTNQASAVSGINSVAGTFSAVKDWIRTLP